MPESLTLRFLIQQADREIVMQMENLPTDQERRSHVQYRLRMLANEIQDFLKTFFAEMLVEKGVFDSTEAVYKSYDEGSWGKYPPLHKFWKMNGLYSDITNLASLDRVCAQIEQFMAEELGLMKENLEFKLRGEFLRDEAAQEPEGGIYLGPKVREFKTRGESKK